MRDPGLYGEKGLSDGALMSALVRVRLSRGKDIGKELPLLLLLVCPVPERGYGSILGVTLIQCERLHGSACIT